MTTNFLNQLAQNHPHWFQQHLDPAKPELLERDFGQKHITKCFPKPEKYSCANNKNRKTHVPSNKFWDAPLLTELWISMESRRWNSTAASWEGDMGAQTTHRGPWVTDGCRSTSLSSTPSSRPDPLKSKPFLGTHLDCGFRLWTVFCLIFFPKLRKRNEKFSLQF